MITTSPRVTDVPHACSTIVCFWFCGVATIWKRNEVDNIRTIGTFYLSVGAFTEKVPRIPWQMYKISLDNIIKKRHSEEKRRSGNKSAVKKIYIPPIKFPYIAYVYSIDSTPMLSI